MTPPTMTERAQAWLNQLGIERGQDFRGANDSLATLLAQVRKEALEEAAAVVDAKYKYSQHIARAIRWRAGSER